VILARVTSLPGRCMAVATPYDPAVVAMFRDLPGCKWDRREEVWVGPEEAVMPVLERLQKARVLTMAVAACPATAPLLEPPELPLGGLYRHQAEGVQFLVGALALWGSALLGDEPGIGKTAQAIRAAAAVTAPGDRILVLCPAVVAPHWVEEIARWLGAPATRLDGATTKAKRAARARWEVEGGWAVCSYDTYHRSVKSMPPARLMVLDELHYLANARTARSSAVRLAVSQEPRPLLIGLTGTPMTARPRDLWHPLELLWPGRFGNQWAFQRRYCAGQYVEIRGLDKPVWQCDGATNLEELGARLRSGLMLRRVKQDVLDLPARQRITMPVELPASARRALAAAAMLTADMGSGSVGRALAAIEEHKIAAAIELAQSLLDQGKQVLLFTLRRETARRIGEALGAPAVTGEDAVDERRARLAGAACGVATVYSVTTGINLTQFDTAVFVGLDWVPSTLLQAEARLHRISQERSVTFYYLIGLQTIDEVIRSKVIERLSAFEQVVGNAPDERALAGALSGGETEAELLAAIVQQVMEEAA
jgi:superfamily II DNA or RNA helicase